MLDRTVITPILHQNHHHRHETVVHEHRAPTDDSLRLLDEMRTRLQYDMLGVGTVNTNLGDFRFGLWRSNDQGFNCFKAIIHWQTAGVNYQRDVVLEVPLGTVEVAQWLADQIRAEIVQLIAEALIVKNEKQIVTEFKKAVLL